MLYIVTETRITWILVCTNSGCEWNKEIDNSECIMRNIYGRAGKYCNYFFFVGPPPPYVKTGTLDAASLRVSHHRNLEPKIWEEARIRSGQSEICWHWGNSQVALYPPRWCFTVFSICKLINQQTHKQKLKHEYRGLEKKSGSGIMVLRQGRDVVHSCNYAVMNYNNKGTEEKGKTTDFRN